MINQMRAQLESIKGQPYAHAHSLPADFYRDPTWFEYESDALFSNQWVCVGRVEEVANPQDYFTTQICSEPVLVVRDDADELRAFSNVCRHRGTVLTEGAGSSPQHACPYHHWVYNSSGKLIAAPGMSDSENFDSDKIKLPEFQCTQWSGFIFVCLCSDPPDLKKQLVGLDQHIAGYHLDSMQLKYTADEEWPVNWKSLLENYMEGYHLTPLHLETLHKVNPSRLCEHLSPGDDYFGYKVGFATRVPDDTIGHPELSEEERNTCVMAAVPPGLGIGIGSDYSSYLCFQPLSPESVRIKIGLIFYGDTWSPNDIESAVELFNETMQEDKDVLLRVRDGLRSKFYQPGPLAPPAMEGTIWDFYQYLSRSLT